MRWRFAIAALVALAGSAHAERGARLGREQRTQALAKMKRETFDLVVVGGGITGAGVAADAASRGLKVALVESKDLAAGTSSRSSKLIHGGLRYLEQLELGLVNEAKHEQHLLRELAPHLVRPVRFLYPLRRRLVERPYIGAGVLLYDLLARIGAGGGKRLPGHEHLGRRGTLRRAPGLRAGGVIGGIEFSDAQVDDARLVLTVARTAADHGATLATRARVTGLLRDGGRVSGVRVHDEESGEELEVHAKQVVNATGVWTNDVDPGTKSGVAVTASKGIHLVVPRDRIRSQSGLVVKTKKSVLFVIPWEDHWIVGTTDTAYRGDKDAPTAEREDVDYLLGEVNKVLAKPLSRADVVGVYAGLRPLAADGSGDTTKASRKHVVAQPEPGLTVVTGGKLTIYRKMAEDAVDRAFAGRAPPSRTRAMPLLGAERYVETQAGRRELARRMRLPVGQVDRLLGRYGDEVETLASMVAAERALARPIPGAPGYLAVEARYAATHEGALHLEDVLMRRTRIAIETADGGAAAAEPVAHLVAPALGWDTARIGAEVAAYRKAIERERGTLR
jgi:glycerol-3-phosphate dehydrogenase